MYRAGSGALVFGAGTVQWAWGLDAFHDSAGGMPNNVENEYDTRIRHDLSGPEHAVQQATLNVLADMGVQPATLRPGLTRAVASTDAEAPVVTLTHCWLGAPGMLEVVARDRGGGAVAALEASADGQRWYIMVRAGPGWGSRLRAPDGAAPLSSLLVRAVDDSLNIGEAARCRVGSTRAGAAEL
ncbi:unnamed protein product [Prorocentrum cordatum]|uniref:Uncharacterized protein n=1 Tax=Prorocentrum cordatum TaxID=2364126 RepID=A0ABN9SKZ5_9DINO|nr:unnamed protein product [Polarella glacialis]